MSNFQTLLHEAQQRKASRINAAKQKTVYEVESAQIREALTPLQEGTKNMIVADLSIETLISMLKALIEEKNLPVRGIDMSLPADSRPVLMKIGAGPYVLNVTAKRHPAHKDEHYEDIRINVYQNNDYRPAKE